MPSQSKLPGHESDPHGEQPTGETTKERLDREVNELMQGLRIAIPGVQMLFAFLLAVPFAPGFDRATEFQRDLYLVTLVAAAVSLVCFVAPAVQHRLLFRRQAKDLLLHRANAYSIGGALSLAVAILSALLLICDYLFSRGTALIVSISVGVLLIWVWLVQPLITRLQRDLDN
jgi:hypothetical protein